MVNNIGERIAKLRKERMMSQEDLAEKVGVSRQAISKWERDEAMPDVYNLTTLSKVLGVTIDEIVTGRDNNNENSTGQIKIIRMDLKKKSEILIIMGVILLILSVFTFLLLPFEEEINIAIFGGIIALAIGIIIYGGFSGERFKILNSLDDDEKPTVHKFYNNDEKESDVEKFGVAVAILVTIAYLVLGFVYDAWHPGWIVFLLVPALAAIYSVFRHKKE